MTFIYTDERYQNMLTLENAVANIDDYENAAFYNHFDKPWR